MRTIRFLAVAVALTSAAPAFAQTVNCETGTPGHWSCQQAPTINWGALNSGPDLSGAIASVVSQRQLEAPPPPPTQSNAQPIALKWSKEGATQESFMKDRFECLRDSMAPNGSVSGTVAIACMQARGYHSDPNGLSPPPGDAITFNR